MFKNSVKLTSALFIRAFLLLALFAAGCQANQAPQPPPDAPLVAEVDLSRQSYADAVVGEFTVTEAAATTLFYTLPNVDIPYFELSLVGKQADRQVILRSEAYRTDAHGGGRWEASLAPGTYRLTLTTERGAGTLSVYRSRP